MTVIMTAPATTVSAITTSTNGLTQVDPSPAVESRDSISMTYTNYREVSLACIWINGSSMLVFYHKLMVIKHASL